MSGNDLADNLRTNWAALAALAAVLITWGDLRARVDRNQEDIEWLRDRVAAVDIVGQPAKDTAATIGKKHHERPDRGGPISGLDQQRRPSDSGRLVVPLCGRQPDQRVGGDPARPGQDDGLPRPRRPTGSPGHDQRGAAIHPASGQKKIGQITLTGRCGPFNFIPHMLYVTDDNPQAIDDAAAIAQNGGGRQGPRIYELHNAAKSIKIFNENRPAECSRGACSMRLAIAHSHRTKADTTIPRQPGRGNRN